VDVHQVQFNDLLDRLDGIGRANDPEHNAQLIDALYRIADELENQTKIQSKLGHMIYQKLSEIDQVLDMTRIGRENG